MRSMYRASRWAEVRFLFFRMKNKISIVVLGSKEDRYRYMVERLGVTGDAGGVDVMVPYPFYLYPSFLTLTLSFPSSHRSMLFFLASILSFVWRTGSEDDPSSRAPLSATAVLGPRVTITGVLVLGLVYLVMIVKTLVRYGRGWSGMRVGAVSVQRSEGVEGEG